jgi:two-component system sensor histidine kinase KdpD
VATRISLSIAGVAAITAAYSLLLPVNPTTVALSYLVMILIIAAQWGIAEATVAAVLATLTFNVFFLPPVGTLTIADPQNWVSFFAFMVTAIVASQLSGRARQRALEALSRQQDLERLYALSRALLLSEGGTSVAQVIAQRLADAFPVPVVAVYDKRLDTVSWGSATERPGLDGTLRTVARQGASANDPSGVVVTAIRLGGAPIGSFAIAGAGLSDTMLQSLANLAAIGLERAREQEAVARAEAARRSSELRAAVLDAVAHEFKTPLTSAQAAASDLLSSLSASRDRELIVIVNEDLDRLQALVTDAVQKLRVDSGNFMVHRERHLLADLIRSIVRDCESRLEGHTLINDVPETLLVEADRDLLGLALRQLLDNAVKYSPTNSIIRVGAVGNGSVEITVHNSGPAIPERERDRIFERFFRGSHARQIPGTGMGLAIVQRIAEAHGGALTAASADDAGTQFMLTLPRGVPPP